MEEVEFRRRVQKIFDRVERALRDQDPDVVECEQAFGSVTLTVKGGARCILSTQPSVQQIWLALASKGIAHHFNFDPQDEKWKDDKGKDIELRSFLSVYLKEAVQVDINF